MSTMHWKADLPVVVDVQTRVLAESKEIGEAALLAHLGKPVKLEPAPGIAADYLGGTCTVPGCGADLDTFDEAVSHFGASRHVVLYSVSRGGMRPFPQ